MFVAYGLSAVFPVIHGLILYGHEQLKRSMGMDWAIVEGVFYILGAAVYAVRIRFVQGLSFQEASEKLKFCYSGSYP